MDALVSDAPAPSDDGDTARGPTFAVTVDETAGSASGGRVDATTPANSGGTGSPRARRSTSSGARLQSIGKEFEELGLSRYGARVVLALLRLGSGNSTELARAADVPRTSVYQALNELTEKGLAERLPGGGVATWTSPGRDELFTRLEAALEDRLRQHKATAGRLRETVAELLPTAEPTAIPQMQLLPSVQVRRVFNALLEGARHEVMLFSRPPYSDAPEHVESSVLDALSRGVRMRSICLAACLDPDSDHYRPSFEVYAEAGGELRLVEELPLHLVVFDRAVTLVAIVQHGIATGAHPNNLLVEDQGFAEVQADAFERRWSAAQPYRGRSNDPAGHGS